MNNNILQYEAIIVGGGKAGKTLAMDMARSGKKVAMIEDGMIGGTCINVACIPTKTIVASAKVAHLTRHAAAYGITLNNFAVDFAQVKARKLAVVDGMRAMNLQMFLDSGMDLYIGRGHFTDHKTLEVKLTEPKAGKTSVQLHAEQIFINTGALPFIPPIPGLKEVGPLTNDTLMEEERIPEHLLIMGGGYIGLEFGQMFRRLGSQVTIIERSAEFLPLEDRDIAIAVKTVLEEEGVRILLNQEVVQVEGDSNQVTLVLRSATNNTQDRVTGTKVLAAVGRIPNTQDLNLAATNVKTDARGFIETNEFLETNVPGIWALGDVKGGPQFTHISLDDYRILKFNLANKDQRRSLKDRLLPYTVFIDPELARIGLTEQEARKRGYEVKVATLPAAAIPRAKTLGETKGLLKAVIDAKTDRILGGAIFCAEGGEVMACLQVAMWANLSYTVLRDGMFAHPTFAEGFNQLFAKVV